jgi:hypothetical protein
MKLLHSAPPKKRIIGPTSNITITMITAPNMGPYGIGPAARTMNSGGARAPHFGT